MYFKLTDFVYFYINQNDHQRENKTSFNALQDRSIHRVFHCDKYYHILQYQRNYKNTNYANKFVKI